MGVKFSGEPQPATYTEATAGGEGSIHAQMQWAAVFGNGNSVGTVQLRFTSVTVQEVVAGGKVYTGVGTLDAVLPSQGASVGSVNLHATFSWR
jgi:hypothetical protein